MCLCYVEAIPEDHALLTEMAIASKASWAYPDELMKLWASELTVSRDYILEQAERPVPGYI